MKESNTQTWRRKIEWIKNKFSFLKVKISKDDVIRDEIKFIKDYILSNRDKCSLTEEYVYQCSSVKYIEVKSSFRLFNSYIVFLGDYYKSIFLNDKEIEYISSLFEEFFSSLKEEVRLSTEKKLLSQIVETLKKKKENYN